MQEPHSEGLAPRDDPEPCIDSDREGAGEASAGAGTGPVWSRAITYSRAPPPLSEAEGHTARARPSACSASPARSETRGLAKGNAGGHNALRTQGRGNAPTALDRAREAAKALRRQDPKQEPSALAAHAGIRVGGGPNPRVKGRPYRDLARAIYLNRN